jgi:hypothetical protein
MFPITFAIITDGNADERINEIIDSIEAQAIPEYEVLVVGGQTSTLSRLNTEHLRFDESVGPRGWITRKKNLATSFAAHDVTVYLHDYHVFDAGWYAAMVEFGLDFDIQMNAIQMIDGTRMFDWLTYDHPTLPCHTPIPYDRDDLRPYQYISGGYWVAKTDFMQRYLLNEALAHHQAEDIEWTMRVRPVANYRMNAKAIVRHNKIHRELANQRVRMARVEQNGFRG